MKTRENFNLTERDCLNWLIPLGAIYYCCRKWGLKETDDNLCLTENRIARGEWPSD